MFSNPDRTIDYLHILILHLLNHFTIFTLPVVILYIRDDFVIDYTLTGLLWTSLVVTNTTLSIFVGFFVDNHREKRYGLIYSGLIIMIIGWALIPFVPNSTLLFPVFIFIGIGASAFHPTAFTLITEMFENDKGKALSYNMAIGMVGNAVAPLLFAGLVIIVGNYNFAIFAVTAFFVVLTAFMFLLAKRRKTFQRIDWRSEEEQIKTSGSTDIMFLLSPLILIPLLFTSIRGSFFRTSSLFTAFLYEDFLFLTKEEASFATAIVLGVSSLFIVLGGWITDKFLPRIAILISSVGVLICAYGLVYINDFTSLGIFSGFFFGLNAFYYIGSPAASTLLANRTRPEQRGKLYGAFFSFGQVLSLGSPLVFGYLNDTLGIREAFLFLFLLAVIAFIIGVYIFFEEKRRMSKEDPKVEPTQL